MTPVIEKYGFPLFTSANTTVYLGHEKKLIISDLWSFWDYIIKKKNRNKKFLLSLLEQAKNFYAAADNAPIKSKPLLYYYSFLNLAKITLSFEHGYNESDNYKHGINERNNISFQTSEVTLLSVNRPNCVQVATEFYELLNRVTIRANTTIRLKDLLSHCVGIHRTYSEIYKKSEIFCKLSDLQLYRNAMTICFKAKIKGKPDKILQLINQGYNIIEENGCAFLLEEYQMNRNKPAREDYFNLSQKIRTKGIWYIVGTNGYTLYLSTSTDYRYPIEMIIYWTIFYLGSITRYQPNLFDEIFSDKEQWLMSEFLETQPKQFLYLLTANMVGQKVLKVYSSI